jgi:hypothetical protein
MTNSISQNVRHLKVTYRSQTSAHIGRRGRSGGSTSRQEGLVSIIACSNAQITTAGLVPVGL